MAWEYCRSMTRVSENTEYRRFKGISQYPSGDAGGLCVGHSGVTFLLWSETLSARTPTSGAQSPGSEQEPSAVPSC